MKFSPIHNHTEYSALDGLSSCREIAVRCQDIGCTCCGISDHGTVAGHLEFGKVMVKHGIKPIFACELYHGIKTSFTGQERDQSHFVAGAVTNEGLRNLWRLVDKASHQENYRFVPRVNFSMLRGYAEGLFATSACIQGLLSRGILHDDWGDPFDHLNRYLDVFGDNFFIELHTYPGKEHELLNTNLVDIAHERGIPLIYATDAHFADPDQYEVHDAFIAMQMRESVLTPPEERKMWHPKSLYIQDESEIRASLSYLPDSVVDEALTNSADLAERCNAQLPDVRRHLPTFIAAESPWLAKTDRRSGAQIFLDLVEEGIVQRYGENASAEIWDRAAREAEALIEAGLEDYFLITWDFCQFCDQEGIIRGPGRGSAAGAIVSYALGITDVDPIHYDLIFERFYNPGRAKGLPDIDLDFPTRHRKRIRHYLMDRWGEDHVRSIGTITRMKPKAALDKTYDVCGITYREKEDVKKIVDTTPDINILDASQIGWDREYEPDKKIYVKESVGSKIDQWISEQPQDRIEMLYDWLDLVEVVCSRISGYGVHPSGIVISDVPLPEELPCNLRGPKEDRVLATCFGMKDVEARGFVKEDILGLRNLDTLEEWERIVGPIEWSGMDKQMLDLGMWETLAEGHTLGIFQIEEGYGRHICKEYHPQSVEDLGVIVALNRPGPLRSGTAASFMKRRAGQEPVTFDHLILEDILADTYGLFLYQEQVIRFFGAVGYDEADGDAVRRILGKKDPVAMDDLRYGRKEWEGKGFMPMAEQAGIDESTANVIINKIVEFSKYSFNKSHAIGYAIIGFRTTYAKWSGAPEFVLSLIRTLARSKNAERYDKIGAVVSEARRRDISVGAPDILRSAPDIEVVDGEIIFGLSNVKGVASSGKRIAELRKQYDISTPELLRRAIDFETEAWEEERDAAREAGKSFKKRSMRQLIPANRIDALEDAGAFDRYHEREISLPVRQNLEKELLGVILTDESDSIFSRYIDELEECDQYKDLDSVSGLVYLPGVVTRIKPKTTRKDGKPMGLVTIEYQGDEAEFAVYPRQWTSTKKFFTDRLAGIFTLKKTDRGLAFEEGIKLT